MSTIVITGANRGIGLELARIYSMRGDTVVAAVRESSGALDKLNVEVVTGIDVTSDAAVATLAEKLAGRAIDVLVNNSGVLIPDGLDAVVFDDLRTQFEINTLGPLRVSIALRGALRRGSKLIFITSRMGSIDDNSSGGYYGYRMSKAALNMAARSLARDLASREIAVAVLHPGMVATRMTHDHGIPPEEAARGLLERVQSLTMRDTGSFWHANGERLPW